ncbi:MAG: class III extradiol ring-cleavage dioxygenase [Sideroxyarcus sp.]
MMMPVLFLSHGAPSLLLEAGETGEAWRQLGAQLPKPVSILVISAHWGSPVLTLGTTVQPETIHDFRGFPEELYRVQYPAPGAQQMAQAATQLLRQANIPVQLDAQRGLDHGAWVPLSIMFPQADIPVAQLSLQPEQTPSWHVALGRALQPLREQGVLIVGSGSLTHNLRAVFKHPQGERAPVWVTDFCDWVAERITEGDVDALCAYRTLAPYAELNHPTEEHLFPLFVALGAASSVETAQHLNRVMTFGMLAMDAWLFDEIENN